MSTSIGTQMQESQHRALKAIAYTLGIIVYLGGVFYAFDIFAMAANAVLDAALHNSGNLTTLLTFWSAYILPALPLVCLLGWTIFFMLDPAHRRRDTLMAARAATEEVLTSRVIEQMKATNLTDLVDAAARSAAAEIVGQTVGNSGAFTPPVATSVLLPSVTQPILTDATSQPALSPKPTLVRAKPARNGRGPEVETADPNP